MFTKPDLDLLLDGVISGIQDDILPNLSSPKALATAVMMQSVIQQVRQLWPVYDQYLADEHNSMIATARETAAALDGVSGEAADRIRARAAAAAARGEVPVPAPRSELMDAHRELGEALVASIFDLDELQRAGVGAADDALLKVRAHLGPRYVRDVATTMVGAGFLGRG